MSLYKAKRKNGSAKSPYWQYDFTIKVNGQSPAKRFHGSTGQTNRRAAEQVEAELRRLAALGRLNSTITLEQACWRYWEEVAAQQPSASGQAKNLELLTKFLGGETLLVSISADLIADAARRRLRTPIERMQRIGKELVMAPTKHYPTTSTVNRQIIEPLRRLLIRAKRIWGVPIDLESFPWGDLLMAEAAPRTRELSIEEELRFWEALRPDYHAICEMYIISGRRRSDWVGFSKFKLDRLQGTARFPTRKRKEKGEIVVDLTARELEIIGQECDKAPESTVVFTYEVAKGKERGKRRPITAQGLRMQTDRAFAKAGIEDFRRHDFRHTFASRALRGKGDLRTLMAAMDHQDISSTVRYAHMANNQSKGLREAVSVNRQYPDNVMPLRGKK